MDNTVESVGLKDVVLGPEIGRGRFATVHSGTFREEAVGVKVVEKDNVRRENQVAAIQIERDVLTSITADPSHPPSLPSLLAKASDASLIMFVLPLYPTTLAEWVEDHPDVDQDHHVRVGMALDLVDALSYMHSHGWIHRDVKPENVMLAPSNETDALQAVLIDMGSVLVEEGGVGAEAARKYEAQVLEKARRLPFAGTVPYMSPEHLARPKAINASSDVWSLGVLLFVLFVSGSPALTPFDAGNDMDTMRAIVAGPDWDSILAMSTIVPNPDLVSHPALDLIKDILVLDQDERPSLSDIAQRLQSLLHDA